MNYQVLVFAVLAIAAGPGLNPAQAALPTVQFAAPVHYNIGSACDQVCTGDFNHDNKPDLATISRGAGKLTILLNNGDGTFLNYTNYTPPASTLYLATGDFNSDGKVDVATVNFSGDSVTVWLGNGDGSFGTPRSTAVTVNSGWAALTPGDFNGDGKLDLALATYGPVILLGRGDGFFNVFTNYSGAFTYSVAAAYLDADTNLDLVTANYSSSSMTTYLGKGDGTFPTQTNYSGDGSEYHYAVAIGDFNRDGKPDLTTLNQYNGSASVRLNNGDGTFGAEAKYKVGSTPQSVAVGDFNGDGNLDVLAAIYYVSGGGALAMLLGNGNGTFATALTNFPGINGNYANQSIAVADFNADGKPDIASTRFSANSVSVLLNQTVPVIQVQRLTNGLRLAWPDWTNTLQSTTNELPDNSWAAATGQTYVVGGQRVLTNGWSAQRRFYRLVR